MIDISQAEMIRGEAIGNYWTALSYSKLTKAISSNQSVLLVDPIQNKTCVYSCQWLTDHLKPTEHPSINLPFDVNYEVQLDPYTAELSKRLHPSWYNRLKAYLYTSEFKQIIYQSKKAREHQAVYPAHYQILNAFLTDFDQLKGCWLGLSPYNQPNLANGFAFATYEKRKPASLAVLENGIRSSYKLDFRWSLPNDLSNLIHQGLLLLNCALTTTDDPRSHLTLWRPFIEVVIDELNSKSDFVWVLWGKEAQGFKQLIAPRHTILEEYHPAYYARNNQSITSNVFKEFSQLTSIMYAD